MITQGPCHTGREGGESGELLQVVIRPCVTFSSSGGPVIPMSLHQPASVFHTQHPLPSTGSVSHTQHPTWPHGPNHAQRGCAQGVTCPSPIAHRSTFVDWMPKFGWPVLPKSNIQLGLTVPILHNVVAHKGLRAHLRLPTGQPSLIGCPNSADSTVMP